MLNMLMLKLKLLRDDKIIILVMTSMALILTFIFSTSMGGGTYKPPVVIINNDNSELSNYLISNLESSDVFTFKTLDYSEGKMLIEEGRVIGGILIEKGFSDSVENNENIKLNILKSKESMELYQLESRLRSELFKISSNYNTALNTVEFLKNNEVDINIKNEIRKINELSKDYWKYKNPLSINAKIIDAKSSWAFNPIIHYLIGFTLFFSTFTIVYVGGDILKEKKQNTWQRKLIAPVSKYSVMMSFVLATFITGFIQTLIVVLIGNYIFDINWGSNIIVVLILFAAFVFAVTCIGLTIAGLVKSYEQLNAIVPVILVSLAMLGGCMWPLEIISSKPLLFLSNITPHKWALQTIERTAAYGLDVNQVIISTCVLIFMGIIYLALGTKLLQRNL